MRKNPPNRKLRRKLPTARDLGPDGISSVETDAHDHSDSANAETAQTADRASTRGRKSGRHSGSETDEPVGYCHPPKHSQFKPGQSGNPKGRSPQSRNFKTMVNKVLGEQVQIREGGRIRRMRRDEALFRTIVGRAFKGDPKATASLIVIIKHNCGGAEAAESGPELLQGVDHKAILNEYLVRSGLVNSIEVGSSPDDPTDPCDPPKRRKA